MPVTFRVTGTCFSHSGQQPAPGQDEAIQRIGARRSADAFQDHSRFFHARNGIVEIYGNASTTVPITTISQFGNTITAPATDFTSAAVTNQSVNVLSPPGGQASLRLGDSTGAGRKEFVFRLDMNNSRADVDAIWQGNAVWPLRLNPSGGPVLLNTAAVTPASSTAACSAGTIRWDADYIYICTAMNTWKRAALATW